MASRAARALVLLVALLAAAATRADAAAASATDSAKPRLAVMNLKAGLGVDSLEAITLTGIVEASLQSADAWTMIERRDIAFAAENYRIELGVCDTDSCLMGLGHLLGAQRLLVGDFGKLIDSYVLNVRLLDISGDTLRVATAASKHCNHSPEDVRTCVQEVVAVLLGASTAQKNSIIELEIPRPGTVSVAIYDASGRSRRRLDLGPCEPGILRISWDGRDDRGNDLPSGLYFARAELGGAPFATQEVTLLR